MNASLNPVASAVDAAVAAGAVLTVVEPWTGQLGGDDRPGGGSTG